ncbi:hypothetical protein ANCDUO_05842 [Ancylostoma duodenale]|uniref:Uncharacterized protein n=1 Tax=Ancylostoma duodenale TaxID=51022 RepID=A0A0C2D372_9BILA|nr:hypothetical protein ANCDUO_05842 [Ancylostoma duodenale]
MWFQFVIQILPWMERSLATVMVRVVEQLCKNIETAVAVCFPNNITDGDSAVNSIKESEHNYPSCFITMTLETITTLLHFCVIDGSVAGSAIQTTTPLPVAPHSGASSMVGQAMAVIPGTKGATELFSNLVKVFSFSDSASAGGVNLSKLEGSRGSIALRQACNDMLTSLPHALATICDLWSVIRSKEEPVLPLGSPQHLRQLVLDLLSPIAQHHQQAFLTALSLVWLTRSGTGATAHRKTDPDQPNFQYTPAQHDIANLLLSLKVISFEELVSAVTDTLKEVGVKATKLGAGEKATFPTEAPLLELVHGCVKAVPTTQLRSCWLPFQSLFSDAPLANLPPRAVFLLYIILCDYVRCAGASYIVEDKTMSRAVQDAVQRLTEAVNSIVGWQLETTTWLKRTLVVKHDQGARSQDASPSVEMNTPLNTPLPSINQSEQNSMRGSTLSLMTRPSSLDTGTNAGSLPEKRSSSNLRSSVKDTNNNKRDPAHSTQALFLLAENLAELVDSVCKSDDKERLLPTLHAVWGNVVPYLRAKNARNSRFFLASSQLLASMSSFSYMRPVWKKTTLELLLDSSFFKMDMQSLKQWLIVTDHLMTHDKTSFKDLLKSIAYTPNASFSIMTSKEQEYEARAQAVKRLAFVVLGSELDQYQAQMNDIQERLSENLRVSQSPSIRSAVFLCIRVLLLRLRPPSLIGIWPIMVTELVHVLLQMEQQLCAEGNGIEDLGCARDDAWMQLYLAACKLLETLCTLPAGYLAQFQMCHWAFVNSVSTSKTDLFLPFAGRINKLLRTKVVAFCLETCNLDGDRALRSQFLPKLLSLILNGLHNDKKLVVIESTALLQVIDVCSRLLEEISQSGAVEVPNGDMSDASSNASPRKSANINPAVAGAIDDDHRGSSELPGWLQDVLSVSEIYEQAVVDAESWIQRLSHSSQMMDASDLSARTTVFDLALSVYLKCASVLSQHEAISGRMADGQTSVVDESEENPTTVLLKPLLFTTHINKLEKDRVFEQCMFPLEAMGSVFHEGSLNQWETERCGHAIWLGLGLSWCAYEHERLSRLMALLHSRKPNEPSSDMENIIVSALTSNDTMISTEAAQTFHRMWMLTRTGDDQPPLCTKPFNRAVMLLLGVLADESVSRARTELKSAAAAWFIDCAKHNDLPRIVQMLATMLMNPVTARISIQYIFQEARLCRDQFSSLPSDVSVVTLVTSDGKQRLYHFDGPVSEGAWQYDLKNRLLLSSETGACEAEQTAVSTCATGAGDIPNFDEDTDSLDTLSISLEGVDGGVVETLQYLIDCVVEEEESELDNQRQLECALANAPPEGEPVIFTNDDDCETETTGASVNASKPRHSSGDRPAPLVGDSVARFKKGHRRQDSLQESIFSMTEKELKTFDATELLRPSVDSTSEGVSLFHELHVHMLLYGESGRVVDLGRAETAFRILTALLCPRGSHVSNRMLLSCLVSSGTAALNGDSAGTGSPLSGSLVDLMAKHVRAILGQHFWGATGDEDATKHRHLTLLELLITISLHFLRSFFLNSPISPVTEADLVMAWKCKIAALDFLSELLSELCGMICEQQSRPFVMFVQSVLSRSKLQKCLLHLLLTAVHDPRANAEPGQT